jgi:hypothetical protein
VHGFKGSANRNPRIPARSADQTLDAVSETAGGEQF